MDKTATSRFDEKAGGTVMQTSVLPATEAIGGEDRRFYRTKHASGILGLAQHEAAPLLLKPAFVSGHSRRSFSVHATPFCCGAQCDTDHLAAHGGISLSTRSA